MQSTKACVRLQRASLLNIFSHFLWKKREKENGHLGTWVSLVPRLTCGSGNLTRRGWAPTFVVAFVVILIDVQHIVHCAGQLLKCNSD